MDKIPGGRGPKTVRLSRVYHRRKFLILLQATIFLIVPLAVGLVVASRLQALLNHGIRIPAKVVTDRVLEGNRPSRRHWIDKTYLEYVVSQGTFRKEITLAAEERELLSAAEPSVIVLESSPERAFFGELDTQTINRPCIWAMLVSLTGITVSGLMLALLGAETRHQQTILLQWVPSRAKVLRIEELSSKFSPVMSTAFSNLASVDIRYSFDQRSFTTTAVTGRDLTPGSRIVIFINPEDPEDFALAKDCVLVEYVPARYK